MISDNISKSSKEKPFKKLQNLANRDPLGRLHKN